MATITMPGMLLTGNHAGRPAANAVGGGTLYACSTHSLVYQSDGSSWSTWLTATGTSPSGSITSSGYTQATARLLGRTTASTGAIEEITVGSGLSLAAGSLTATGGSSDLGGKQLDYQAITAPITVNATSEGAATTIATSGSIAFDGSTEIQVELSFPRMSVGTSGSNVIDLYLDSTIQGRIAVATNPSGSTAMAVPLFIKSPKLTPSNASHTLTTKVWRGTNDGELTAGTGGTGAYMNGYQRVVRVTS